MRFYSSNEVSIFCEILRSSGFSVSFNKMPLKSDLGKYISQYNANINIVSDSRIEVHFRDTMTNEESLTITADKMKTNMADLEIELDDIIDKLAYYLGTLPTQAAHDKKDTIEDLLFQLRLFREKMHNGAKV